MQANLEKCTNRQSTQGIHHKIHIDCYIQEKFQ